jgi:phosphoribosyl-AMP cyclohydrolase / phosphoribosyl-ATP pyrophosphohydrolase
MAWLDELTYDDRGLVPVVAQEADSGEVLMLAWANRDALERTVATGAAHYWSRSRGALWRKGDTSGHVQEVVEVRADCDADAVLYRVRQTGPACHTLATSCFHRAVEEHELRPAPQASHILARVEEIVRLREEERPEGSYTTYLFDHGIDKVLKKVGEEATEVVIAAKNGASAELTPEVADLLFHLLVVLRLRDVPLPAVWAELERRFGSASRVPARSAEVHPHS